MGFKFPYGAMQQLNLDWFIKQFNKLRQDWATAEEGIAGALQDEIDRAETAMSDVFTARDTAVAAKNDALTAKSDALQASANAAQYWQNAANSASAAAGSAGTALQAAEDAETAEGNAQTAEANAAASNTQAGVNKFMAEAWAAGTMNGTPVGSGTIQYQNNAKYYAQQASGDAAQTALDRAAVAQDKDDTDAIKDNANAAALRAEGWADGTQNGTPVTSGSPYYENNAKYYKEAAEDVLDSIPEDYSDLAAEVASQSEKIDGIYTDLPHDNLLTVEAFKLSSNSSYVKSSIDDNGGITIWTTTNRTYGSFSTPTGYAQEYFTPGKKYRVHFSASVVSGSPYITCRVRGTQSSADDTYVYGGTGSAGTYEFDFVMTEYVSRISLFVTYSTSATASAKYYDFWVEEVEDSAIDLTAEANIALNMFREKNIANGFNSLQINNLFFERGGIRSSGSNIGNDYNGDATYQAKSLRTCGWFSIDSYYGDIYFIADANKVNTFKVLHKFADQSIADVGVIDANHPICVTNNEGDSYRIGLTWNNADDAYKASEWRELIDIAYYPTRLMSLSEKSQSKKQYCVMTQNVGEWYNGSGSFSDTIHNSALALHNEILKRYSPDILACQEYVDFKTLLNPFYTNQFSYFPNTNSYVGKFVGTNYGLEDSEGTTYTNQDSGSTLLWNYTKSYVWLSGRKVCVIATHLSTTSATGVLQVQELFDIAEEEDYVIICGDFNADCDSTEDQNYIDYYKPFVDAGYNLANCSTWGFMPTWYQAPDDASPLVLDNIITSGNIAIKYACVDSLKREEPLDETKVDHLPLIAYIEFDD